MKKLIYFLLYTSCCTVFAQDIFKDVQYEKVQPLKYYSNYYNNIIIISKNAIVINFSLSTEMGSNTKCIVFDKDKIFKTEVISILPPLEENNHLKLINVEKSKEAQFYSILDTIISKGYLKKLKQEKLDYDHSIEAERKMLEEGESIYSHCGTIYLEFYQGKKSYKLNVECPNSKMGRDKEKLDLFNELYKLLDDTWNIQNGTQGRFIEAKENN